MARRLGGSALAAAILLAGGACAQAAEEPQTAAKAVAADDPLTRPLPANAAWLVPQTPVKVYGSTYFVGFQGLSVALIDTGQGLILVDVNTMADGEFRNNFLKRAITWNPNGVLNGARGASRPASGA